MSGKIDLPVGTRFTVVVNDEHISVEVVKCNSCVDCVFYGIIPLCKALECRMWERKDHIMVTYKKIENTLEMKNRIELPVGTRFNIWDKEECIPVQAVAGGNCTDCVLNGMHEDICDKIECRRSFRTDKIGIILMQLKNTKKTKK